MIVCPNPECGGVFPPAAPGEWVCRCGSGWAADAGAPTCEQLLECDGEPVITVMAGCVHEHLVELAACQWHVESLANDAQFCGACVRVDGHLCELILLKEATA